MNGNGSPAPAQEAFVIHFHAPGLVEQGASRGHVEHVASGEASHFSTRDGMMAMVTQVLAERAQERARRTGRAADALAERRREAPPLLFPGACWRYWKQ